MKDLGWSDRVAQCYAAEVGRPFNRAFFESIWDSLLLNGNGAMWKYEHDGEMEGIIAGMVHPDMFDGELVAAELVWFVSPAARSSRAAYDLWHEFKLWAQAVGAVRLYSAAPAHNPKLGDMFTKRGAKLMETYYTEDL